MRITKAYAEKDFNILKSFIKEEIEKENYTDAFSLIQCCSNLAYHLNFKYVDEDLENYLFHMSQLLLSLPDFKPRENKWVFYDSFGLDNRGLTQQYLTALDSWDVEYLYILEKPHNLSSSKNIINQVKNNPKAQIYIIESITVDNSISNIDSFEEVQKIINKFAPQKAFLHIAPWSVFAITTWIRYESLVTRYLINLTDHAFWLGKSCLDFNIEFRDYGCNISNKFRKIKNNQIIKQLYYPILISSKFQGFPQIDEDKVVIFTGGAFYKMYGEDFLFLNMLKTIVEENDKAIILIAGNGDSIPLKNFILKHNLMKKILIMGNRTDISEVFKRIDIYVNTYPLMGGLMSQYAVMNKKPLIGFNNSIVPCNNAESLFETTTLKFTYFTLDEFYSEINQLINNANYRQKIVSNYSDLVPSENKFSNDLAKKLSNNEIYIYEDINIDLDRFCNIYCDMENNYLKQYDLIKFKWIGLKYFKYDFLEAFFLSIRILINNRQRLWSKIKKKLGIH